MTSLLDTIGHTPLRKLSSVPFPIYAKVESANPGGSVKDRIALFMIKDAEEKGLIHPGDTLVEGTSGNTGYGVCLVAKELGYKVTITIPDKFQGRKTQMLEALGAEVIVCPSAVKPTHPGSYYSQAEALGTLPGHFYL